MDWQPIETAPKDGTKIILGQFDKTKDRYGRVRVDYWHKVSDAGSYSGWGEFNNRFWPPTHWMPLPAPPKG